MLYRGLEFVNSVFEKSSHCKNALTRTEPFLAQVPPPSDLLTYVKSWSEVQFSTFDPLENTLRAPNPPRQQKIFSTEYRRAFLLYIYV